MKIVLDTNIIVSGLLQSKGNPALTNASSLSMRKSWCVPGLSLIQSVSVKC